MSVAHRVGAGRSDFKRFGAPPLKDLVRSRAKLTT
jgi:hypothetical protein